MNDQMSLFNKDSAFQDPMVESAKRAIREFHNQQRQVPEMNDSPDLEAVYRDLNEALEYITDHNAQLLIERARNEIYRYLR